MYHVRAHGHAHMRTCACEHEGESSREKRFVVDENKQGRPVVSFAGVYTRVCAEEERLHARECVPQEDWRRAGEGGRAGSSAWNVVRFTVHMYSCSAYPVPRARRQQGCIRSRCTDTRKSWRKRRMRLNAVGWQRRSAERMVSCRSVQLGVLCVLSCVRLCKDSRERRRRGRGTGSSILNTSLCASARGSVSAFVHAAIAETHSRHVRKDGGGGGGGEGGERVGSTRGRERERSEKERGRSDT